LALLNSGCHENGLGKGLPDLGRKALQESSR
jgi:hypothetical protein